MNDTKTITIEVKRAEPTFVGGVFLDKHCEACDGTGAEFGSAGRRDCAFCAGTGLVPTDHGYNLLRWLKGQGV